MSTQSTFGQSSEILYDYVEDVDPNLICAICQSAFVDPVTTTSCKHTFCRDCITHALAHNAQCPIDRSALTAPSLRDTEQLVKLMLDELKVRCAAEDCGQIMQRGLLLGHIRSCQKVVITCSDAECGLSMTRQRLPHHRAYDCFQRKMECGKCGVVVTFRERAKHDDSKCNDTEASKTCKLCSKPLGPTPRFHAWSCPMAPIPCPHHHLGCSATCPRQSLAIHLQTCPFEALAPFFQANERRFSALEAETGELRRLVVEMRGGLLAATRDIDMLRMQLGGSTGRTGPVGWFSPAVLPEGLRSEGGPSTEPRHLPQVSMSTTNTPESVPPQVATPAPHAVPAAMSMPPEPYPSVSGAPISSASSLLTPVPLSLPSPNLPFSTTADLPRSLFAPSFGSHRSHADWAFATLGNAAPNLPPQSVEEAISGLRRAIVGLAAGLDTMERRNEVRTMTENLRVLEEVGSLRAIVSTMRMQVMNDRSRPSSIPNPRHQVPFASMHPDHPTPASPSSSPDHLPTETVAPHSPTVSTSSAPFTGSTTSLITAGRGRPMGIPADWGMPDRGAGSIRRSSLGGVRAGSFDASVRGHSSTIAGPSARSRLGQLLRRAGRED